MRHTLGDCRFDGGKALELIIEKSAYGGLLQAVASLALFSHPETVAQTQGHALFRIVRGPIPQRGHIVPFDDGKEVLLDDNTGPTDAFLWANQIRRGAYSDVQFCHIWQNSGNPRSYTNLANICVLPAFLAKLSDTHAEINTVLKQRVLEFYGWHPHTETVPSVDRQLTNLEWAPFLPANLNVERTVRDEMRTKAKSRTTISASRIGWLFSGWNPDGSLPRTS
jgi:hypothetical protein